MAAVSLTTLQVVDLPSDEPEWAPTGAKIAVTLGQRVKVAVCLRRTEFLQGPEGYDELWRIWNRVPVAPIIGIVVGTRTLASGIVMDSFYHDEPVRYLECKRRHHAVLVAYHLRRKPVLVLTDDIEPLEVS